MDGGDELSDDICLDCHKPTRRGCNNLCHKCEERRNSKFLYWWIVETHMRHVFMYSYPKHRPLPIGSIHKFMHHHTAAAFRNRMENKMRGAKR